MRKIHAICLIALTMAVAADTPRQWSSNPGRNLYVPATDLPDHIGADNLLWHLQLGGKNFFNIITVDGDRVYCGMSPKNLPEPKRARAALLCLDLNTGKPLWEHLLDSGTGYGLDAVPLLEEDAIYLFVPHEMLRLTKAGELVWKKSMSEVEHRFFGDGHGAHSTGIIVGDYWYQPTGTCLGTDDGRNWAEIAIDLPWSPNIIVRNKHTGELVAQDDVVLKEQQHGSWSSLSSGVVDGRTLIFWGDPSGFVQAFEAQETFESGKVSTLRNVWSCDVNPPHYRVDKKGVRLPYETWVGHGPKEIGPCEVLGVPVFHDGLVYATITRDKAYSGKDRKTKRKKGAGAITCINPKGEGDITRTNIVWQNDQLQRTFCPVSIHNGMAFVADLSGHMNGFDLKTGKRLWQGDTAECMWNYWQIGGDNKIFTMNEKNDFFVFSADREGKLLFHAEVDSKNNPTPGITNGRLIVGTRRSIAAYGGPKFMQGRKPAPLPEKPQFKKSNEKDDNKWH